MRRTNPGRATIVGALVAAVALSSLGAGPPPAPKKKAEPPSPKVDETIADVANIAGQDVRVEGVGLVMGLDNTGGDPAPSSKRTKLLDDMRKANVEHPERILQWPSVTMVIVRGLVPAGVTTADKFDVEIELPPACPATSLAGGWLVSTQLGQKAMTPEGMKDDKIIASAGGPIMIGNADKPGDPKVGRVLGGGRTKEDSPYALSIKEARRSGKTSALLQNVVKERFHQVEGVDRKGMAVAKTDSYLTLKVPRIYHHNQDRYHQVLRLLPLVDNPELRTKRLDQWGKDLLDPKKAGMAALKLEGLGSNAIPTLKSGLKSPDETVQFFAAEALAYLNDNDGDVARILSDAARKKPDFRSYALKAMAATDQSASLLKLRALMSEPEFEVRYGAFDALRTLDPTDPFLGRARVLDEPPAADDVDDMALQIAGRAAKKPRKKAEEPFALYVVDCEGPPMVHVARNIRCEIVVFGKGQKLLTPVVLGSGGPLLLNASDGDSAVQITKITAKTLDSPMAKLTCPLDVAEVVREMANLGASYPEIVAVLNSASAQKNLPGPLVVDAVPLPNKAYDEAQHRDEKSRKDEALKKTGLNDSAKPSIRKRIGKLLGRDS